jgi:MoCo/4Fe-4S cofactor protein with predicted Tat translocation signal
MSSNKKYWKSVEELENGSIVEALRNNEFVEAIPTEEFLEVKRLCRLQHHVGLLKYVGFSTAAATLAAEGPVVKSIPYVLQPEQIIPGVADYYATSVLMVLILQTYLLKLVRVVLSKLTIILSQELDFPLMLEFMHRYCRYMTTCV